MTRRRPLVFALVSSLAAACGEGSSGGSLADAGDAAGGSAGSGGATGGSGGSAGSGGAAGGSGGAAGGSGGAAGGSGGAAGGSGGATGGSGGATGGSGGATGGSGGAAGGGGSGGTPPETVSRFIVVDQIGYTPDRPKYAVLRDPVTGFDANDAFTPGATYALVDAATGSRVLTGAPVAWNGGATDPTSGDRAWRFDFSSVTTTGDYYVVDESAGLRSQVFRVAPDVYRLALKHAGRTFFYQRAGQDKTAAWAGAGWVDGPSHLGALQDSHCRRFDAAGDASTERDLRGGWYDAGDYNKYTSWTARYVLTLLHAYAEHPSAFGDDWDLPESGNGIPDVLDEARWGLDYLARLQEGNGSVLSIVGVDSSASPPSAANGPSLYGPPSTSATLSAAAAYAYGSVVLRAASSSLATYSDALATRAENAWTWASANPNVQFQNNDGTNTLGAGQQETDDYGRLTWRIEAATYLYEATGSASYKTYVDANYAQVHLVAWSFAYPFEVDAQAALLHYAALPGSTASVRVAIRTAFVNSMTGNDNLGQITADTDPYRAYLKDYVWGSNGTKAAQGSMFWASATLDVNHATAARDAAAGYVHYLHGLNPLGLAYLSNFGVAGAEQSVKEFYHSWFADGSALWDRVGSSTHGPPPGFLTGGPNPSYARDGCCPSGCGSAANNAVCTSESLTPPEGQPAQKSYKDFNTSWPLNSWSVTENSDGYQVMYLRLLSKLVD